MRWYLFVTVVLMVVVTPAFAESNPAELVIKGNALYKKGDYHAALKLYQDALTAGADNGHVYFNLGNTLYRLGNFGRAIGHYRLAREQLPRDADIKANLALARKHATDKIARTESSATLFNPAQILFLYKQFSVYEIKLWSLIACAIFSLLFALQGFKNSTLIKAAVRSSLVLCVFLLLTVLIYRPGRDGRPELAVTAKAHRIHPAVVVVPELSAYSGNSETFQVVFLLHEGAEIEVKDRRENWAQVILPGGRKGWVKTQQIMIL